MIDTGRDRPEDSEAPSVRAEPGQDSGDRDRPTRGVLTVDADDLHAQLAAILSRAAASDGSPPGEGDAEAFWRFVGAVAEASAIASRLDVEGRGWARGVQDAPAATKAEREHAAYHHGVLYQLVGDMVGWDEKPRTPHPFPDLFHPGAIRRDLIALSQSALPAVDRRLKAWLLRPLPDVEAKAEWAGDDDLRRRVKLKLIGAVYWRIGRGAGTIAAVRDRILPGLAPETFRKEWVAKLAGGALAPEGVPARARGAAKAGDYATATANEWDMTDERAAELFRVARSGQGGAG